MIEIPIIEVCVDSLQSAKSAEDAGASRVELCDNLFQGGTTPSAGMIEIVRENISIGLQVIIRPRGGDFLYSSWEFQIMKKDIEWCKKMGVNGVVLGILTKDGKIDIERNNELIELSQPMNVTFHRAFDMLENPLKSLYELIDLKVDRILTSGQEATAFEGAELIAELIRKSEGKIAIMPGGGISERNIGKIRKITGASEFHLSGRSMYKSEMVYRKTNVYMGGQLRLNEFENSFVDPDKIVQVKSAL